MRILLDTNVIISSFVARGLCEAILEYCLSNHEILLSESLFEEIRRNLRKRVKLDARITTSFERLLREHGTVLEPACVAENICRDPEDLHILGLALVGKADYLVTGDDDLLSLEQFGSCRIVNLREFWTVMHEQ